MVIFEPETMMTTVKISRTSTCKRTAMKKVAAVARSISTTRADLSLSSPISYTFLLTTCLPGNVNRVKPFSH
jgi:hypothetical protein